MGYSDFIHSLNGIFQPKNIIFGGIGGLLAFTIANNHTSNSQHIIFVTGFMWIIASSLCYLFHEIFQAKEKQDLIEEKMSHVLKAEQATERLIQLNQFVRLNTAFNDTQVNRIEEIIDVGIRVVNKSAKIFPEHQTSNAICHFLSVHFPLQVHRFSTVSRDSYFYERQELFKATIQQIYDELHESDRIIDKHSEEEYVQKYETFIFQCAGGVA